MSIRRGRPLCCEPGSISALPNRSISALPNRRIPNLVKVAYERTPCKNHATGMDLDPNHNPDPAIKYSAMKLVVCDHHDFILEIRFNPIHHSKVMVALVGQVLMQSLVFTLYNALCFLASLYCRFDLLIDPLAFDPVTFDPSL